MRDPPRGGPGNGRPADARRRDGPDHGAMLHSDVSAGRSRRRRVRALAVAAGVAGLVLPGAAAADSIVYVDGGNVWSASPDGAHKVQLTDGGDWHSPTQSD